MARFQFRLQTLRRLREIARDELRGRLAAAYEAERILQEQRAEVAREARAVDDSQRRQMQQGPVDVNQVLNAQRYRLTLQAQGRALDEQAVKLAEEVERRRQALVEADREVRVLDKLEQRLRLQHEAASMRAETKLLDEVAVTRWEAAEP